MFNSGATNMETLRQNLAIPPGTKEIDIISLLNSPDNEDIRRLANYIADCETNVALYSELNYHARCAYEMVCFAILYIKETSESCQKELTFEDIYDLLTNDLDLIKQKVNALPSDSPAKRQFALFGTCRRKHCEIR